MLNQLFTADNFRKIFDYENRKGHYIEDLFFPEIELITKELKSCAYNIRTLKKNKLNVSLEDYEKEKSALYNKTELLKKRKYELLTKELEKISDEITTGKYKFKIKEVSTKSTKKVFNVEKDACGFFAIKQLQFNLSKLYKVQQSNRYNIVKQLSNVLNDQFPKVIFRTDINNFYESIPIDKVLKKICSEHLLTSSSKSFIKQIIADYKKISTTSYGVPRGIGISAYLSELYMRRFDYEIRHHSEIIFYARYVDDIIIIISPKPNSDPEIIIDALKSDIASLELTINSLKTSTLSLLQPKNCSFEYLGYTFSFGTSGFSLSLSSNRLLKYKKRIDLTFQNYHSTSKHNEKRSRKLLIKRIKFLTGNTRLLNNKKNALVGIYFSNSLITDSSCLTEIDKHLMNEVKKITAPSLNRRLNTMSFKLGFDERRFHKFSSDDLAQIVKVWKHVA